MSRLIAETMKSSLFVVRESLSTLRTYSQNLNDEAVIDRVVKEAEILSTSLKKLSAFISQQPGDQRGPPQSLIDPGKVLRWLDALERGAICPSCGMVKRDVSERPA